MCDDDSEYDGVSAAELAAILAIDSQAERLARIRGLSNSTLARYYALLSDPRLITNVSSRSLIESEIVARGLPLGRPQ